MMQINDFWEEEWNKRILGDGTVKFNVGKAEKILGNLKGREYFKPHKILDIGCGPAFHAIRILQDDPTYKNRWYGIDLAQNAVQFFQEQGLQGECGSIYNFNPNGNKFGIFLLLDTLEHIMDRDRLAGKIKELAEQKYIIFGNIPLYTDKVNGGAGFENPMDIGILKKFMKDAGIPEFDYLVYGIYGWPYMMFEGKVL